MFGAATNTPFAAAAPAAPIMNAAAPTSSSPAAPTTTAAAAAVPAPPSMDFLTKLKRAAEVGTLPDNLANEIVAKFSSPFSNVANATPAAASTSATTTASNNIVGVGASALSLLKPGANNAAENVAKSKAAVVAATELLHLLLMAESGTTTIDVEQLSTEASKAETVAGLHGAVGGIGSNTAANLIYFVRSELAADRTSAGSLVGGPHDVAQHVRADAQHHNPALLAAQCLYLLTRHFQMQPIFVKEAISVVDRLFELIQQEIAGRDVQLAHFREAPSTAALCAITWLMIFSIVNAMTAWKRVRSPSGILTNNALLQSDVGATLDAALSTWKHRFVELSHQPGSEPQAFLSGTLGAHRHRAAEVGAKTSINNNKVSEAESDYGSQRTRWIVVVDGFMSVLRLCLGCFMRAKGDEKGYDVALEAFLGHREHSPRSIFRGKATKRMLQLAPSPSVMYIPMEHIFIAPYELLSFLFDDMLPLLRHLSDLEIDSQRRYVEQRQSQEEVPMDVAVDGRGGMLGRQHGSGGVGAMQMDATRTTGNPFTSEMSHLLEALSICLAHLPPEVLNPDLDVDCAATFFIFRNCVKHIVQLFTQVHRGSSVLWESCTLKLVARFLEVLTMIGRNPQYMERLVELLTGAQVECRDIQWVALVQQALECAGFHADHGDGFAHGPASVDALYPTTTTATSDAMGKQRLMAPHRQFTPDFFRKCKQQFMTSFFMLLRQLFTHPTLRRRISEHLDLRLALSFIFAPHQTQHMLGSTLSLVGALISSPADAALVWQFLEEHHLLQPNASGEVLASGGGATLRIPTRDGGVGVGVHDAANHTQHLQLLPLFGHCQYEASQGTYSITIGFLNLILALFSHDAPHMLRATTYSTVAHFISHDIFRGASKRAFSKESDRSAVIALAATVLEKALRLKMSSDGASGGGSTTMAIPFATVMATSKAPTDVLGEALQVIMNSCSAPYELMSDASVATRQCLKLLIAAIVAEKQQKVEVFSFDSRTTQNASLAFHVLLLSTSQDPLLVRTMLQLLALFPLSSISQATRFWYADAARMSSVVASLASMLHPHSVPPVMIRASPELAVLDYELHDFSMDAHPMQRMAEDIKALLLDVLIQHASVLEPSLAAWMCGFYAAVSTNTSTLGNTAVLNSIVNGAMSKRMEEQSPLLALKYVKLLYLLRANRLYGRRIIREVVERRCEGLFFGLAHFHPSRCPPLLLSKYAYILKLLALEAAYAHEFLPEQLTTTYKAMPSVSMEVLMSIVHPHSTISAAHQRGDVDDAREVVLGDASVAKADVMMWLGEVLSHIPVFPACHPPNGSAVYMARASDGAVQYDMRAVCEALQAEQERMQQPLLNVEVLRERLQPYIRANECFLTYASVVNFAEGWCQLVDMVCSVVRGISTLRLRDIALCIIRAIDRTSAMTISAQEQIVFRLSSSLSTIMAHLKERVEEEVRRVEADGTLMMLADGGANSNGAISHLSGTQDGSTMMLANTANNSTNFSSNTMYATHRDDASGVLDYSATRLQRRSGSASLLGTRRGREPAHRVNAYGTIAGDAQNLLSATSRGKLPLLVHERRDEAQQHMNAIAASLGAQNQQLLQPLVLTLVGWGGRIPSIRNDLYQAFLHLTMIPGVVVEDVVVYRSQRALLDVLVADLCAPRDGLVAQRRKIHALTLLTHLVQSSTSLCGCFCSVSDQCGDGLGPLAMKSLAHLLHDVDEGVSELIVGGGADAGYLLWLIRGLFDLLCAISHQHASQLLQSTILHTCLAMRSWSYAAHVVLGHTTTNANSSSRQQHTQPLLEQHSDVLKRLLLGVLRWLNVMSSTVGESEQFISHIHNFVRQRRQLMECWMESPLQHLHSRPVGSLTLAVYAELTELLRALASSPTVVDECRLIAQEMALTPLLNIMASSDFAHGRCFASMDVEEEEMATTIITDGGKRSSSTVLAAGSPASTAQEDLIAIIIRNLSHFLLRSECGSRMCVDGTANNANKNNNFPLLRENPRQIRTMTEVAIEVAHRLELCCSSRSVLPQLRVESYLHAMHALVCLLYSFVVPGEHPSSSSTTTTTSALRSYLTSIPLSSILQALIRTQSVVYELRELNADYRRGIRVAAAPLGWSVEANSMSNAMMLEARGRTRANATAETSSTTAEVMPTTPQLAPLGGGNALMQTKSASAVVEEMQRPRTNLAAMGELNATQTMLERSSLALSGASRRDARTRVSAMDEVADEVMALRADEEEMKCGHIPHTFDDVLCVENSIRQTKISIANAIRATKAAMELTQ